MSVADVVAAAKKWLAAKDATRRTEDAWRSGSFDDETYMALEAAKREENHAELVALGALADIEHDGTADDVRIQKMRTENQRLIAQVRTLKDQVRQATENNARRNRELDALHYVWCDGGCSGGLHRYCSDALSICDLDVQLAERCVARLRCWWENHKFRERRGSPDKQPNLLVRTRIWLAKRIHP